MEPGDGHPFCKDMLSLASGQVLTLSSKSRGIFKKVRYLSRNIVGPTLISPFARNGQHSSLGNVRRKGNKMRQGTIAAFVCSFVDKF